MSTALIFNMGKDEKKPISCKELLASPPEKYEEISTSERYAALAQIDYNTAHYLLWQAKDVLSANLANTPTKLNANEARVIAKLGEEIGQVSAALEERIKALADADQFEE